jgi:hypothetical protein
MLFHLSEDATIERLEPRAANPGEEPLVWAIHADRIRNYLVPRDCPRVTFWPGPNTSDADRARFLNASGAPVVAVENAWFERLRACRLYRYHLNAESFTCIDANAGYFVSRAPVTPTRVDAIEDPFGELARQGVEVRLVPSLWELHDAIAASSVHFSMIRMRNASRVPSASSY